MAMLYVFMFICYCVTIGCRLTEYEIPGPALDERAGSNSDKELEHSRCIDCNDVIHVYGLRSYIGRGLFV